VVNTHHLAHMVEAHLADRVRPRIHISREPLLLETGGGVARALGHLGAAPFFVANSDGLWREAAIPAFTRLAAAWDDSGMDALLLVRGTNAAIGYDGAGDFELAGDGRLSRRRGDAAPFVFMGVQLLHPRLFRDAPGGAFSLNLLYDRALATGRLHGLAHTGDWFHVGTPAALATAERAFVAEPGD
jgi:MurNAc alpha-1-phosphate uridylyltransferase